MNEKLFIFSDLSHSEMVYIPAGTFIMGDDKRQREKPEHQVHIKKPFWLGKYPVTQALWKRVMKDENPSYYKGDTRPVEQVSWNDVKDFLIKLKEQTGKNFALPSEAQWEYGARGGKRQLYAGSDNLKEVGWYDENSYNETMPVGLKAPNAFGLHDMSGNVWEWCEDDWHSNYNKPNRPDDGQAWIDKPRASSRVQRGGGYFYYSEHCRVSSRSHDSPVSRNYSFGFRLAFSVS